MIGSRIGRRRDIWTNRITAIDRNISLEEQFLILAIFGGREHWKFEVRQGSERFYSA